MSKNQKSNNSQQITSDPTLQNQNHQHTPSSLQNHQSNHSKTLTSNSSKTKNVHFHPELIVSNSNLSKMSNETPKKTDKNKCACSNSPPKERVSDLKEDLQVIGRHLVKAYKNKKQQKELEVKLNCLIETNKLQKEEIEDLQRTNDHLLRMVNDTATSENVSSTKQQLDKYNSKLLDLYNQFTDTVDIFEKNKKQIKTQLRGVSVPEFERLLDRYDQECAYTVENCRKYKKLKETYDELKQSSKKLHERNEELAKFAIVLRDALQKLFTVSQQQTDHHQMLSNKNQTMAVLYNKLVKENQQLRRIAQALIEVTRDYEKHLDQLKRDLHCKNIQTPCDFKTEIINKKDPNNVLELVKELNELVIPMYQQIEESLEKDEIIEEQIREIQNLQSTLNKRDKIIEKFQTMISPIKHLDEISSNTRNSRSKSKNSSRSSSEDRTN